MRFNQKSDLSTTDLGVIADDKAITPISTVETFGQNIAVMVNQRIRSNVAFHCFGQQFFALFAGMRTAKAKIGANSAFPYFCLLNFSPKEHAVTEFNVNN